MPRASWLAPLLHLISFLLLLPGGHTVQQEPQGSHPRREDVGVIVPSISGVARASFFQYASQVALQQLHEKFQPTALQDTETMAYVPVVGAFRIKLTDTVLLDVAMDDSVSGLSLAPQGKMLFAASGVKAHLRARFHYRRTHFPVIAGEGDVAITIHEGDIRVLSRVVNDGSGRPHIILDTPVDVAFGSVGLRISGCKFSWLYNAVLGLVGGGIKPMIVQEVAGQLASIVPAQANEALKGVPTVVDVQGLQLNTSMDGNPLITALEMSVQDWGRFQSPGGAWEECPYRRVAPQGSHQGRGSSLQPHGSHGGRGGPVQLPERPLRRSMASRKLQSQPQTGRRPTPAEKAMISVLIDESIVDCFTWALWRQGKLARYLEGDEVPDKALHTVTWLLAIPQLPILHPNSLMGLQASVSTAPLTQISASRGISSSGNATLEFFLADPSSDDSPAGQGLQQGADGLAQQWHAGSSDYQELQAEAGQAINASKLELGAYGQALQAAPRQRLGKRGQKLFTLDVGGQLIASQLAVEPNPAQAGGFRLRVKMQLVHSSLWIQVAETSIGFISAEHLQVLMSLASVLVEDKINNEILKDGIALPPVQHVQPLQPSVTLQDYMISMNTNFEYVP